jgi:small conductance mechanosensitive channel
VEKYPAMSFLTAFENSYAWFASFGRVVFVLAAAYVASIVIKRMMRGFQASSVKLMMRHAGGSEGELEKRAATIAGIVQKASSFLIAGVAIVMVLREIGFDITPILTGVGVAGLAVGFGAQNLVRDVISGFFMLIENQIRTNDVAIINGTGGLVEEMNLRTTVLRSQDGAVHIFPNGTINSLSNMTREYSYYVLDVGIAYREDTDRVTAVLREVAEELSEEPAYSELILAPLEVLGVDRFTDSSVVIKSRIKTPAYSPVDGWQGIESPDKKEI